jgi:hypothetical protein
MKQVPLNNNWEFEYYLTQKNSNTRVIEPLTGLSGLKARFSGTDGGAALDPTLEAVLTERSGAPGYYAGTVLGSNLQAHMSGLNRAFEVFLDATGTVVLFSEAVQVLPVRHK